MSRSIALTLSTLLLLPAIALAEADLIFTNGKIVTVDSDFRVVDALAVKDGRILAAGSQAEVQALRDRNTRMVDLKGKMILPGLIDSHVHPEGAVLVEYDHPVPPMETIAEVLDYVRKRAQALEPGKWIYLRQVFITRLKEQRYPTRQELDEAAPNHPVVFATGPDEMLNSMALKLSGIDRNFKLPPDEPGFVERDATGEPTGILRAMRGKYTKRVPSERQASDLDVYERLRLLFSTYNSVGLTTVSDRNASSSALDHYRDLKEAGELTVRMMAEKGVATSGPLEGVLHRIRSVAEDPLHRQGDANLRIIGIKTFLDGGMLTGSAYMQQPWGVSKIYGIADPEYRGVLNIPFERLVPMVREAAQAGLQFTAHSVGNGAVKLLLDAYEEVGREFPIARTRPSITHSNFMSQESVERAARLGVVMDIQPAWLYLDAKTLTDQFGYERLRYFQPLRTIFEAGAVAGGGTDHMQKIPPDRAVNPYNPFLGMWVTITRKAKWFEGSLHPEEALTREQAIRFYTANNAYLLFLEKEVGSLEPGKRADFIIVDRDLLTCPEDDIRDTQVLATYLDGKQVYQAK